MTKLLILATLLLAGCSDAWRKELRQGERFDRHLERQYKRTDCKFIFTAKQSYWRIRTGLELGLNEDMTFILLANQLPYSGTWEKRGEDLLILHVKETFNILRQMMSYGVLFRGDYEVRILNENELEFMSKNLDKSYLLTREK